MRRQSGSGSWGWPGSWAWRFDGTHPDGRRLQVRRRSIWLTIFVRTQRRPGLRRWRWDRRPGGERNAALEAIADALEANAEHILEANRRDLAAAERLVAEGKLTLALVKRLKVDEQTLHKEIAVGVRSVADQPEPIGRTLMATELDEGLKLYRVSVPIGVIGVIFESRPDAMVQIATLCLKSGNAVLLKGGSEALQTNRALAEVMRKATRGLPGIPEGWMHLLEAREEVRAILDLHDLIDLVIPRGGE